MNAAKIAVVVFVVVGLGTVAVGAGRGWFARSSASDDSVGSNTQRQEDVQNAARAVAVLARAAAEHPTADERPPAPVDAVAAEPEAVGLTPAPAPAERPPSAAKTGEVRWMVKPPPADAAPGEDVLCGGKVCAANQFCCGPPACGHCANRLTGPRCPATCP